MGNRQARVGQEVSHHLAGHLSVEGGVIAMQRLLLLIVVLAVSLFVLMGDTVPSWRLIQPADGAG